MGEVTVDGFTQGAKEKEVGRVRRGGGGEIISWVGGKEKYWEHSSVPHTETFGGARNNPISTTQTHTVTSTGGSFICNIA